MVIKKIQLFHAMHGAYISESRKEKHLLISLQLRFFVEIT